MSNRAVVISVLLVLGVAVGILLISGGAALQGEPNRLRAQTQLAALAPTGTMALTAPRPTLAPADEDRSISAQATPQARRLVIRNANLNLVVTDVRERVSIITSMAEEMGGWVVSSEASQLNRNSPDLIRAVVSIRVPAERLDEALVRIKNGAVRILNETITGQDVTDQYTDLMSNLKNLQAAEEQLRKILEAATSTEDVLNVYRELTRIRGEIEVIQGRLNYLEQSAAYSSIVVTLQPELPPSPTPTATATPTAWSLVPVAEQAGASLVGAFQGLLGLLVWAVVFVLPLALVIGLPTLIVLRVAQRFWPKQPGKGTVEQPAQSTDKK